MTSKTRSWSEEAYRSDVKLGAPTVMVVPCAKMRGSQGAPSITRPSLHYARVGQQFARYPTSPPTSTALSHPLNNPVALAVRLVKSMKKECLQDEEPRPDRLDNPANNIIARQSRVTPEEPRPNLSDEKKNHRIGQRSRAGHPMRGRTRTIDGESPEEPLS